MLVCPTLGAMKCGCALHFGHVSAKKLRNTFKKNITKTQGGGCEAPAPLGRRRRRRLVVFIIYACFSLFFIGNFNEFCWPGKISLIFQDFWLIFPWNLLTLGVGVVPGPLMYGDPNLENLSKILYFQPNFGLHHLPWKKTNIFPTP